jgi:phosphohistidine phosphatase SixA
MEVIFFRHATAEAAGPGGDAGRKLTADGRGEALASARALRAMGVKLGAILTSPLVRAEQTADAVARVYPKAGRQTARFLAPPGDFGALRRRLSELLAEKTKAVALVGHTPSLEEFVGRLVGGAGRVALSLTKAGAACVLLGESADSGGCLQWLLRRQQLALLAGK